MTTETKSVDLLKLNPDLIALRLNCLDRAIETYRLAEVKAYDGAGASNKIGQIAQKYEAYLLQSK